MRQSKWWQIALSVVLLSALVGGCKSTKGMQRVQVGHGDEVYTKRQFIQAYQALQDYPIINARGTVSILVEGGRSDIRLNDIGMRWYLERGKAYELSLRPVSFVEMGRLTVAEDQVLALDRMNQLYFHLPNAATAIQKEVGVVGLDPRVLEAFVSYTPFNFVEQGATALDRMDFKRSADGYLFSDEIRSGEFRLEHRFDRGLNLLSTHMILKDRAEIMVTYGGYTYVESPLANCRPLPTTLQMELKIMGAKPALYALHFRLSQVDVERQKSIDIRPPFDYRQVRWSDLLELIAEL